MIAKCPGCGKAASLKDNPFRPFCSERCRLLDLGRWLDGAYGIAAAEEQQRDPEPDAASQEPKGRTE